MVKKYIYTHIYIKVERDKREIEREIWLLN